MKEKRNIYWDEIRGVAVVLVVLGHAIQYVLKDFDKCWLFSIIYSFHMPLFVFLSGVVSYNPNRIISRKWLKDKFKRLVIPFVVWIFIPFFIRQEWEINEIINKIIMVIMSPDNGKWFLWITFLDCILLFVGIKMADTFRSLNVNVWLCILVLIINFINLLLRTNFGGLSDFAWYSVFFVSGYLIVQYRKYLKIHYQVLMTAIFLLFVPMWSRTNDAYWIQILYEYEWNAIIYKFLNIFFSYVIAYGGIAFIFLLVKITYKYDKKQILSYIGNRSLEIYVLHTFWNGLVKVSNPYMEIALTMATNLILSLITICIINEEKLGKLIFGKGRS